MPRPAWSERAAAFLLRDPRALVALTIVYVGVGLAFLATDTTLNDEGFLTYIWSSWARHDFLPAFFFQKSKPVLVALYLPAALGGARTMLGVHLAVVSLAIPLVGATARALGMKQPNVAAWTLAFSPIFFVGGAAGLSNADGVLGTALVTYLLVARRYGLVAGVVLGALPWVRHELALFTAVVLVWMVVADRRVTTIVGVFVFPVLYGVAGAVYHHDALWLIHYPPTTVLPMPGNPVWVPFSALGLLENLLSVTPLVVVAFSVRVSRLTPIERVLLVYTVLSLLIVSVLPIFRVANFGFLPRYSLQVLPAVALLAARVVEPWDAGERTAATDFVVPALFFGVWLFTGLADARAIAPALVLAVAALHLADFRRGRIATFVLLALACAGPVLHLDTQITRDALAPELPGMTAWLRAHRREARGPVYTNAPLLAPYLDGSGRLPGVDVRYLVGVDQYYDLVTMSDVANGQRAALRRLLPLDFYGHGVPPDTLSPETVPASAVFLLRDDPRVDLVLTGTRWARHLAPIARGDHYRILRFSRGVSAPLTVDDARALLAAAIEAHGGRVALAALANVHVVSEGRFGGRLPFRRTVDYRAPDAWSMTVAFAGGAVMRFGVAGDRCWRSERYLVSDCSAGDRHENVRIAALHEAHLLQRIDERAVQPAGLVDVDGRACPAIRAGALLLAFDPATHRLAQVRLEDRVDTLSDDRRVGAAMVAMHRVLTIGGALDVDETWTAVVPGGADADGLRAPELPADGSTRDEVDAARAVAWTELDTPTRDLAAVIARLDAFIRAHGQDVSDSDGVILTAPSEGAPGDRWRLAVGVQGGGPLHPAVADGMHLETWPALRTLGVFQRGDPATTDRSRSALRALMRERGLAPTSGARWQVLFPRADVGRPPAERMSFVRIAVR